MEKNQIKLLQDISDMDHLVSVCPGGCNGKTSYESFYVETIFGFASTKAKKQKVDSYLAMIDDDKSSTIEKGWVPVAEMEPDQKNVLIEHLHRVLIALGEE